MLRLKLKRDLLQMKLESILLMLAPITPHLCQYLWWQMYPGESIVDKEWPEAIEELLVDENIKIAFR